MGSTFVRQRLGLLGLGVCLLLGVGLRLYGLGDKLLWHDELATRVFAAGYTVDEWQRALYDGRIFDVAEALHFQRHNPERSVAAGIRGLAEDDPQHPPLYYVLTRIWVGIFGDDLATLRALSALFGILTLFSVYWWAQELFRDRAAAGTSVALLAVSPFFVLYAQEAREYALWALWISLSSACLLMAIRTQKTWAWALYSLLTVLSLYTSFSSASVILAHITFLLWRERLRPTTPVAKASFLSMAAAALAFLPWGYNLSQQWDAFQITMRWSREIIIPKEALLRILGQNVSRTIVDFWPELTTPLSFVVMGLAVALVLVAWVQLLRRAPPEKALLLLLFVVPIGVLLGPDLIFGGIRSISMRYLTPAWLAVILALGFLLSTPAPAWRVVRGLVLVVSLASAALNAQQQVVWTKATSVLLPEVAARINAEPRALLVGNRERHSAGNLMALSVLLKPGTQLQWLDAPKEKAWVMPKDVGTIFLFNPIPDYRVAMEAREQVRTKLLLEDHFTQLWVIEPGAH
jgi:uncharacterized membrane protein